MKVYKYNSYLAFIFWLSLTIILLLGVLFYDSPEWFQGGARLSDLLVNICLSYIAAYLFYYISVFRPLKRNLSQLEKVVAPLLFDITSTMLVLMEKATNKKVTQIQLELETIDSKAFESFLTDVYPDTPMKDNINGMTVGSAVTKDIEKLIVTSKELLSYVLHMEPSYISTISKIIHTQFFESWINKNENYGKVNTLNNTNLTFVSAGNDLTIYSESLSDFQVLYREVVNILTNNYENSKEAKKYKNKIDAMKNKIAE